MPEHPPIHLPGLLRVSHFPIIEGRSGTRELRATNKSYGLMSGLLLWSEITVTGRQIDFWLNSSGHSQQYETGLELVLTISLLFRSSLRFDLEQCKEG